MPRTHLWALLGALALGMTAVVLRLLSPEDGTPTQATDLLRPLIVGASLCVAILLRERAPAGAWLATVSAGGLAALEVVGVARDSIPVTGAELSSWLVLVAEGGLVGAASISGAYAVRAFASSRSRWGAVMRRAILGGWLAVVAVAIWAIPMPLVGDPSPLRVSGRLAAGFVAITGLIGVWGDLGAPLRRARARTETIFELPRALIEELLPGAADMRRRLREEERAQLAADLHARVLPDLRRAAGDTTAGSDLRQTLEDVEQLMHARQSVVLEEYGLVAALEWLAERTQGRIQLVVEVELDGNAVDDPVSLPKPVARAAFRVALLALDNVVRHAGATHAAMRLTIDPNRMSLAIVDDGRGFDSGAARHAGRGLVDMRAAAAEVGGAIRTTSSESGSEVQLSWSVASDPVNNSA